LLKSGVCSLLMGLAVWQVSCYTVSQNSFWGLLSGLVASITAGVVSYGLLAFCLRSRELGNVMGLVKRKQG